MNQKRIFALGFFDGVHLGHQALLTECCGMAAELGCQTAAITFDKHPQSLFVENPPGLLCSARDRQRLLRRYGIEAVYQLPVVREVMSMPWQDFYRKLLEFDAAGFVCGVDFSFGHKGEGTARLLAEICRREGLPCVIVPDQTVDGIRVSSTHIRDRIESGDMETAVRFLGHPHILSGSVEWDADSGSLTAGMEIPRSLVVPGAGVYACRVTLEGKTCPAEAAVTASGRVEIRVPDITEIPAAGEVTLEFCRFLRP